MKKNLYNIPYTCSPLDVIAGRFLEEYKDKPLELCDVLFLMPNRRSCLSLKEAFLRKNGLTPFLLPTIVPVQDVDEDEMFLFATQDVASDLPATISARERQFLLAKMIFSKHSEYDIKDISFAQSLSLASDLANLMDAVYNDGKLSFDNLKKIAPEKYAKHWNDILKFLQIVTEFWPEILKDEGVIDAVEKRNILIDAQTEFWKKEQPKRRIVAIGLTAAFDCLKKVLRTVFELENGEIYFYGLDRQISEDEWKGLSETHPQFAKKEVLDLLGVSRSDVQDAVASLNEKRERFVFEVMREAATTEKWCELKKDEEDIKQGLNGIHLIEARDSFEEAASIALIMKKVLSSPQKTAALVTTDRTLARETADVLKRFDIEIDDSAGLPLHLSQIGIYLRQISTVLDEDFNISSVAALLKSPYVCLGESFASFKQRVNDAELKQRKDKDTSRQDVLLESISKAYEEMKVLYDQNETPLKDMLSAHIRLAEALAKDDKTSGADLLWRHEDGRLCAAVLAEILDNAQTIGVINPKEYTAILTMLLSRETVRKPYGSHPRLKILGPIEARFNHFDVMIAGSLNEGVWPKLIASDPFMSVSMKETFGLPLPQKAIGIAADDLSALMCADEVYLTRAQRVENTPMNKSRYWLRLETVLNAIGLEASQIHADLYLNSAVGLDMEKRTEALSAVCPTPPVEARPRKLSATDITKWLINPYEIFASKILELKRLDALEKVAESKDFGLYAHKVFELFCRQYPSVLDENAEAFLKQTAEEELKNWQLTKAQEIFWKNKIDNLSEWFLQEEKKARDDVKHIEPEIGGETQLDGPKGPFTIFAKADRLEETKDGFYRVADYKTGQYPSKKAMSSGFAPQLLIEALIAESGGFKVGEKKLQSREVEDLIYWPLGERLASFKNIRGDDLRAVLERTENQLKEMIAAFDDKDTPYLYNPNPKHCNKYSDYEHLSRVKEWGQSEDSDE